MTLGEVMEKLTGLAGVVVLAVAAGACSSSGSSSSSSSASSTASATATPKSGTETVTGTVTGTPVINYVNNGGKASLSFPSLVFTGPVDTTSSGPVSLGGSTDKTSAHTFVTTAGHLTVQRTSKTTKGQLNSKGKNGGTCYFAETGTYSYAVVGSQSTGEFAGATGSGTGATTVVLGANLLPGKATCSVSNTSGVVTKGASITFKLSGPLTLKQ